MLELAIIFRSDYCIKMPLKIQKHELLLLTNRIGKTNAHPLGRASKSKYQKPTLESAPPEIMPF